MHDNFSKVINIQDQISKIIPNFHLRLPWGRYQLHIITINSDSLNQQICYVALGSS